MAFGISAGITVGQYYSLNKKLEKEFDKSCEEDEKASDIEKKKEISKLVNCLNNYLELRNYAENN